MEITGTILITHIAFFGALFATANHLATISRQNYKPLADAFLILFTSSLVSHWSTKKSERGGVFHPRAQSCLTALSYGPIIKYLDMSKNEVDQLCAEVFERCAHYNITVV